MSRPIERLDCSDGRTSTDYRTVQAESIRLPGETAIDKCVRLAKRLQTEEGETNLAFDLPNPNLPRVFNEIEIPTFLVYVRVTRMLAWLEVAARRTYRKNRSRALARLYSNLEKESGVSQSVFREIRSELKFENLKFLGRVAECVLRKPIYDPLEDPQSLRRLVRRRKGNVIYLHNESCPTRPSKRDIRLRQLSLPLQSKL